MFQRCCSCPQSVRPLQNRTKPLQINWMNAFLVFLVWPGNGGFGFYWTSCTFSKGLRDFPWDLMEPHAREWLSCCPMKQLEHPPKIKHPFACQSCVRIGSQIKSEIDKSMILLLTCSCSKLRFERIQAKRSRSRF